MEREDLYISVDVEASGPVPALYSMLSVGACVVGNEGETFYRELKPVTNRFDQEAIRVPVFSAEVMAEAARKETRCGKEMSVILSLVELGVEPTIAMQAFADWVKGISVDRLPLFVGWNAPFDWSFVNYYFHYCGVTNPFGITAIDVGAYYMGMSGCSWSTMRISPDFYPTTKRHTHHALDDAIAQAESFGKMLKCNLRDVRAKE